MDPLRWLALALVSSVLASALGLAWLRGVRALYPTSWRRAAYAFVAVVGAAMAAQPLARALEAPRPVKLVLGAITALGLLLALFTTPFLWMGALVRRRAEPPRVEPAPIPSPAPRMTRRELALAGARLAPASGVALVGVGGRGGSDLAQVVELAMAFPDLPPALEGLRILQFSDVHLGAYVDLEDVRALVELARKGRADLIVLTGDVADDLSKLPEALHMLEDLGPRLGVYASIGNHEYFRGITEARRAYDRTHVPLLLERGLTLPVGTARLHLSGADDPRFLGRQNGDFFQRTVATTLDGAPSDAFHVLMSHRPEGFTAARAAGVHLTLAGHTHGAQLGFRGRSLFEPLLPDKYLWGAYQAGGSRLYTSSGAGHWLPFRVGCPRELPVIELVRGPLDRTPAKRVLG